MHALPADQAARHGSARRSGREARLCPPIKGKRTLASSIRPRGTLCPPIKGKRTLASSIKGECTRFDLKTTCICP
ncbi:hypothetical protein K1W54_34195 [Micromonospora sp. CPCC 205371]|nr:hypothetical protein [Micromonospora sp. CPCC 205371]